MCLSHSALVKCQLASSAAAAAPSTFKKLSRGQPSYLFTQPILSYFEMFPGVLFECLGKVVQPLLVKMTAFLDSLFQEITDSARQ